ncbi:MAG: ATP-binding cassette domain-containing protein [Phycisphaerales bacterium]|nr:ATP-binding cassette domain-containing protein [Phycisphaerales bacterium]
MDEPAIVIDGVSKSFGSTRAVRDMSLVVPRGIVCGFLGPNGAGKSTTIRMIMSIIYPDGGRIAVLGGSALSAKDRIGYLPEERGLYRKMRVGDFLAYMARLKGVSSRGLHQRIEAWLERMELPGVVRRRCSELSKGMQQKVQFIAALVHEPELVILDEPFSGLDPVNAEVMRTVIQEQRDAGRTVIFSTHIMQSAERLCDRLVLINRGEKLLDATMDEIRARFSPRTVVADPIEAATDAARIADGLPGVVGARVADDGIEVSLAEDGDPQVVMAGLLKAAPLRRVGVRRVTLEEVFVRLVRRGGGEAAAAEAERELTSA